MIRYIVLSALLTIASAGNRHTFSQDETNTPALLKSWLPLQLIPSPVVYQDSDKLNAKSQFGFRWQLIPLNISFRPNRYNSPVQFFKINPVRRFTGSMEIFVQPEWTVTGFQYAGLSRFGLSAGGRVLLPIKGDGEKISFSIGGKYSYRKDLVGTNNGYWGIETGVYVLFGILGLQMNYHFDDRSRFDIGFYFKYF